MHKIGENNVRNKAVDGRDKKVLTILQCGIKIKQKITEVRTVNLHLSLRQLKLI
jgi:hypothetical protein